jgi:hypothetical protein
VIDKTFADYRPEAHLWITLSTGDYYPDVLPLACELYQPVLVTFGQLIKSSHSSQDLFLAISEINPQWMRIQLCRVFRKYVSPETPVEMLKHKSNAQKICQQFGLGFRQITEVQARFESRPMPDETLCAILWEYKDRGKKGYDLTERFFNIIRNKYQDLSIIGSERAGKDVKLNAKLSPLFKDYPNPARSIDFVIFHNNQPVAIGLARYDSDRGGSQEDDRPGQYRDCAKEVLDYAQKNNLNLKIIFLNDGPGLLLGSMWNDYAALENYWPGLVKVITLRMIEERLTMDWLLA